MDRTGRKNVTFIEELCIVLLPHLICPLMFKMSEKYLANDFLLYSENKNTQQETQHVQRNLATRGHLSCRYDGLSVLLMLHSIQTKWTLLKRLMLYFKISFQLSASASLYSPVISILPFIISMSSQIRQFIFHPLLQL